MSLDDVLLPGGPLPPSRGRSKRADRRAQERARRRRQRRTWSVLLLAVVLVGGGVGAGYAGLAPVVRQVLEPKDWPGEGEGQVAVKILPGATGRQMARVLVDGGVVKTEQAFVTAHSAEPRARLIQPGTYRLRQRMSSAAAVAALLDPASRLTRNVTVPEGYREAQIVDLLAEELGFDAAEVRRIVADARAIGLPSAARGRAEGFLFPATYEFEPDVRPAAVLRAMVERNAEALEAAGVPADRRREVVIKASIVQKEAGSEADMPKVARVIENRLRIGMKLQMDSTVHYGAGRFSTIATTDDERADPSRYNTYYWAGLPAGPIGNPGEAALRAVLRPAAGDWLYFVTVNPDSGLTKFADSKAEHDRNALEFKAWQRANPGR